MKLYVALSGKQVTVSKEPAETRDENGRQKSERATGRLMVHPGDRPLRRRRGRGGKESGVVTAQGVAGLCC
jgi:hypothetical protein